MEIRFQNRYERSKALLTEAYFHQAVSSPFSIIEMIIGALMICAGIGTSLTMKQIDYPMIIIGLLMLILPVAFVPVNVKRHISSTEEIAGGRPFITIYSFTDEKLTADVKANDAQLELPYSSIKSAARTKNLIVITTNARQMLSLRRDGFIIGTEDEFMKFIKEKIAE